MKFLANNRIACQPKNANCGKNDAGQGQQNYKKKPGFQKEKKEVKNRQQWKNVSVEIEVLS